MARRQFPWSVVGAGVLVLLAAGIGAVATASDPATRQFGLPGAGLAAVIGLGLLMRRRWAIWAGFGLVAVGAVLTAASFRDAPDAGPMMAWFTGLLLLPALRRRVGGAEAEPVPLSGPPGLGQWLLFGLFAVPTVVVGMALFVLVPFGWTSGWSSLGAILVLVALLLVVGGTAVMFRPRRRELHFDLARLSIEGAAARAFLARYDHLGRTAVPGVLGGMAVVGVPMLIEANLPAVIWVPVAILAGLAAISMLVLLATDWRSYVALVPSGLYVPGASRPTFVPWAAVQDGFLHRVPHRGGAEPFVAVAVSNPAAIRTSLVGRLLHAVNRGFGGDLYFPARIMATEPEFLVHAIDVYRSSPERREAIGTAEELERLRSEWAGSAA
jgi:hypothetical protein